MRAEGGLPGGGFPEEGAFCGKTVRESYDLAGRAFREAGVPEPDLDAWYLLEEVTGISRASFYADPDREMTPEWSASYGRAVGKRIRRIPLQHITGKQEFMGLTFHVNRDVLIPRQDTETLVEEALRILRENVLPGADGSGKTVRILDLCTGSGCILLSVLHYAAREAEDRGAAVAGTGADLSERALFVARKNAEDLGIRADFVCGDLFAPVSGRFSMILSNPPYIKSAEIETLEDEVRLYDPREALDGSEDGLAFYRRITADAGAYLEPGGYLVFEIGYDQAEDVAALMRGAGYTGIRVEKDLAGLDRVVCGVYSGRDA